MDIDLITNDLLAGLTYGCGVNDTSRVEVGLRKMSHRMPCPFSCIDRHNRASRQAIDFGRKLARQIH